MTVTYPKSGLQDSVGFQKNGKPGTYPVQAWNDEIGTFQFASTLAEGYTIPFGAAVLAGVSEDGIRLPNADDAIAAGQAIEAQAAKGTLTFTANPSANDTVTVGEVTYKFVTVLAAANDVLIGSTKEDTASNLDAAINDSEGEGTIYGTGTAQNAAAESTVEDGVVSIEAFPAGTSGNSVVLASTSTAVTASGETLSGGVDESTASAATASFVGVAVFNYYSTVQAGGYKKQDLDVNVAVKQKGYVTVLMSSLEGADFQKGVALDPAAPGKFKVAGEGDVVVAKINKIFPDYGTAEILLKEFI